MDKVVAPKTLELARPPYRSLPIVKNTRFLAFLSVRTTLQANLDSALVPWVGALGQVGQQVSDVVPRMSVQTGPQTLLVKVMRDQTDTPTEHEQAVEDTHVHVVFGFLGAEGTAVPHQIDEADGDAAVDVENEIILLRCSDGLDGNSVVEHLAAGKALLDEFFDELDTEIGIIAGLDFVTDTGD